jgi:hypothetical protein
MPAASSVAVTGPAGASSRLLLLSGPAVKAFETEVAGELPVVSPTGSGAAGRG